MRASAAVSLVLILSACAHPVGAYLHAAPGDLWIRTELYCGTLHDGKVIVTDEAWDAFLKEVVTPRFPDGLTVLHADGQWASTSGLVREPSRVLVIFHAPTITAEKAIEEIRAAYRERFHQTSVLRITELAKVSL